MSVEGANRAAAGRIAKTMRSAGDFAPLVGTEDEEGKEPLAVLLRPTSGSKVLVVSSGHRVSVTSAVTLTAAVCRHSIPEPVRQADLKSRSTVLAWFAGTSVEELTAPELRAARRASCRGVGPRGSGASDEGSAAGSGASSRGTVVAQGQTPAKRPRGGKGDALQKQPKMVWRAKVAACPDGAGPEPGAGSVDDGVELSEPLRAQEGQSSSGIADFASSDKAARGGEASLAVRLLRLLGGMCCVRC